MVRPPGRSETTGDGACSPRGGSNTARVRTQRGLERIVVFADAVVAIACTLLVLPLVDLATQDGAVPVERLLSDHIGQFGAFALSFAVIARLWVEHHRLFEGVGAYDRAIIWLTLGWLFTVAFLPFPTAILATQSGRGASTLYIGTLLLSSLALAATSARVSARPALQRTGPDATLDQPTGQPPRCCSSRSCSPCSSPRPASGRCSSCCCPDPSTQYGVVDQLTGQVRCGTRNPLPSRRPPTHPPSRRRPPEGALHRRHGWSGSDSDQGIRWSCVIAGMSATTGAPSGPRPGRVPTPCHGSLPRSRSGRHPETGRGTNGPVLLG